MDVAGQNVLHMCPPGFRVIPHPRGFMVSLFFSLICMGVLSVYMSAHHSTPCACGGQRRDGGLPGTGLGL